MSQVGSNVNKPGKGAIRMTAGSQGKIIAAHEEEYFYMQVSSLTDCYPNQDLTFFYVLAKGTAREA